MSNQHRSSQISRYLAARIPHEKLERAWQPFASGRAPIDGEVFLTTEIKEVTGTKKEINIAAKPAPCSLRSLWLEPGVEGDRNDINRG